MAPSFLRGVCVCVWTSRAAPRQEMVQKEGGEQRERGGGELVCSGATGRGLDDAKLQALFEPGGEREKREGEAEKREGEADMQATEESGNTPTGVT